MNHLFICSANQKRSKTAEDYFAEKYVHHEFLSAGTNINICRKLGTQELTDELLNWADKIYVMENKHQDDVRKLFGGSCFGKIKVLNILDRYNYMDSSLVELLERLVKIE